MPYRISSPGRVERFLLEPRCHAPALSDRLDHGIKLWNMVRIEKITQIGWQFKVNCRAMPEVRKHHSPIGAVALNHIGSKSTRTGHAIAPALLPG